MGREGAALPFAGRRLHCLSDVLGAYAAGVAWLALCVTSVETFRRYREQAPQRSGTFKP